MENDERNKLYDDLSINRAGKTKQELGAIVNQLIENGENIHDISAKAQVKASILQEWLDSI